jgi:hypothetical protein
MTIPNLMIVLSGVAFLWQGWRDRPLLNVAPIAYGLALAAYLLHAAAPAVVLAAR